jgi:septal ring factor EnvC (AmiA/AmiB activator)
MNRIESQVRNARRRLILGAFGRSLCVTLFVALIIATIACALPGIRAVDVDVEKWNLTWILGSIGVAVMGSLIYALAGAPSSARVALEVDKRFGLNERLSSSLSMTEADRESEFGLAVISDADRRAEKLEIAEKFSFQPSKMGWLPLAIAPLLFLVVLLVDPAQTVDTDQSNEIDPAVAAQVKRASLQLKKRIEQQKRNADAKGLKDAHDLFEKLERDLNKITEKKNVDRKEAMIALNDLKKVLEERRDQLGSSDQMRKAMSQMKSLQAGPAEEVAKSIAKGDFGKAEQAMQKLAKKLKDGKLTEKEKEQLQKQVEQLKNQLEKSIAEQKQKQQELKQKIEQAKREGRSQEAAKMQQQLNEMQQQSKQQMRQMQQMADQLGQAAQAIQNGNSQQAASSLEAMADQLGDMQQEMSELKDLEDAMNDLAQSKEQMRCTSCGGAGCQSCQGMGMGQGMGDQPGEGLGEGSGKGDRPEEEDDTNTYETQVRGQVKKGKAVISGFADGPNRKGISREDVKAAIENSFSEESDPLENQQLPRTEREHAMDYFNKLRSGK